MSETARQPDASPSDAAASASWDVRAVEAPAVAEFYFNVRPGADMTVRELYAELAARLRERGAKIFSERVFLGSAAREGFAVDRRSALGDLDDGVGPMVLCTPPDEAGVHGMQVHAVRGAVGPEVIERGGEPIGRRLTVGERSWIHLATGHRGEGGTDRDQAYAAFRRAVDALREQGLRFDDVARTWLWLRDILHWYPELNEARTAVFRDEGMVAPNGTVRYMPASTGVGVTPGGGGACGLELIAIDDGTATIKARHAGGDQGSAFSYGSAFARAASAPMPAGRALFISGTAAIDAEGISEHHSDIKRQIDATLRHIRALLDGAGWQEEHVVSAIAYCKSDAVARAFGEGWATLSWPRIEVIADVCRDELLFEIEVTAAQAS